MLFFSSFFPCTTICKGCSLPWWEDSLAHCAASDNPLFFIPTAKVPISYVSRTRILKAAKGGVNATP